MKKHVSLPVVVEGEQKPSNIIDNQLKISNLQRELKERLEIKDKMLADFGEHTAKLVKQLSIGEQFEGQITMLLAAVDEIRGFMKVLGANAVLERQVLEKLDKALT